MKEKHICVCCYLNDKQEYYYDANKFGVTGISNFYEKYVSQGMWTRRLQCQRKTEQHKEGRSQQSKFRGRTKAPECTQRSTWHDMWNQPLTPLDHVCSACKNVFDASSWQRHTIYMHQSKDVDLVCPDCTERGYSAGKYEAYECRDCKQKLGSLKFAKMELYNFKRKTSRVLVCQACQKQFQCQKCKTVFKAEHWTKAERRNHRSDQKTPLVCKDCRALGRRPSDLASYDCQGCGRALGAKMFNTDQLKNYKYHQKVKKLKCKQCIDNDARRVRQLCQKVRQTALKCNCKCRIHRGTCPLTPVYYFEKRWPGKDKKVTDDDRRFLEELRPPPVWWSRAWGRAP